MGWTSDNFTAVFWVAVVPAFLALALIVFAVREPDRPEQLRTVRNPISPAEIKNLGPAYWWVVAVASVFTLARFSEAFLVLRAQNVGLPIMLVPAVLVAMNVVYAVAAYPAGVISDRISRTAVLAGGILLLIAADIALALLPSIGGVALGVVLWGLHMGLTQGLLAALVADTAPAELRGTAYGFFNLLGGVAMLAASIIAGALWDITGPQGTFLAGAGFALIALTGLLMARGKIGGKGAT
jgi:MFS family permease